MKISVEKTELVTNGPTGVETHMMSPARDWGQSRDAVQTHGAVISSGGSKPDISTRTALRTDALAKVKSTWRDGNISLKTTITCKRPDTPDETMFS